MKTRILPALIGAMVFAGLTLGASSEVDDPINSLPLMESLAISEPGFEANGSWKLARTGAGVEGLFLNENLTNYLNAGLIDKPVGDGSFIAYNNGPQHDIYQVLESTLAAKTTYKFSIVAIDATFANPFPGGELRLGSVSDEPEMADDFGRNLLAPIRVENPMPFNDHENDPDNVTDGIKSWTWTFTTGAAPAGIGQKLRIEILGGGKAQSLFDNAELKARAATPAEIESASKMTKKGNRPDSGPPVVVMLGDSTTEGGMPVAVRKELEKLNLSKVQLPIVINAGKGGDNATAALSRLEKDVLAHKPDLVTISFGLNDVGLCKPEEFEKSLKKMIGVFEEADIPVMLMTSTPFNNRRHGWGKKFEENGGLDEYLDINFCEEMRSLARDQKIPLCDLHHIFKEEFKKDADLVDQLISGDGVHLTARGYDLIAKHVAPKIVKELSGAKPVETRSVDE